MANSGVQMGAIANGNDDDIIQLAVSVALDQSQVTQVEQTIIHLGDTVDRVSGKEITIGTASLVAASKIVTGLIDKLDKLASKSSSVNTALSSVNLSDEQQYLYGTAITFNSELQRAGLDSSWYEKNLLKIQNRHTKLIEGEPELGWLPSAVFAGISQKDMRELIYGSNNATDNSELFNSLWRTASTLSVLSKDKSQTPEARSYYAAQLEKLKLFFQKVGLDFDPVIAHDRTYGSSNGAEVRLNSDRKTYSIPGSSYELVQNNANKNKYNTTAEESQEYLEGKRARDQARDRLDKALTKVTQSVANTANATATWGLDVAATGVDALLGEYRGTGGHTPRLPAYENKNAYAQNLSDEAKVPVFKALGRSRDGTAIVNDRSRPTGTDADDLIFQAAYDYDVTDTKFGTKKYGEYELQALDFLIDTISNHNPTIDRADILKDILSSNNEDSSFLSATGQDLLYLAPDKTLNELAKDAYNAGIISGEQYRQWVELIFNSLMENDTGRKALERSFGLPVDKLKNTTLREVRGGSDEEGFDITVVVSNKKTGEKTVLNGVNSPTYSGEN